VKVITPARVGITSLAHIERWCDIYEKEKNKNSVTAKTILNTDEFAFKLEGRRSGQQRLVAAGPGNNRAATSRRTGCVGSMLPIIGGDGEIRFLVIITKADNKEQPDGTVEVTDDCVLKSAHAYRTRGTGAKIVEYTQKAG